MSQQLDDRTGALLPALPFQRESYREWLIGHVIARDVVVVESQQKIGELALRIVALEARIVELESLVNEADTAPMTLWERLRWIARGQ